MKKITLSIILGLLLFSLVGCERKVEQDNNKTNDNTIESLGDENKKDINKKLYLKSLINLSTSDIYSIKISEGGGMLTKIEDSKQIEEICSFLSKVVLSQEYAEEKSISDSSGGFGAYFLIVYSNNTSSHIQVYVDDKQVKISGDIKDGTYQDMWRIYTIFDLSSITKLKEILSIKPIG